MLKDKVIAERELRGRKPNGHRVRVTAKLYSLGEQEPYFSITTDHGCDHESVLAAFPQLDWLVALHLSNEHGVPMHAEANALYHAEEGDKAVLARHLAISEKRAEQIIGRVACAPRDHAEAGRRVYAEQKEAARVANAQAQEDFERYKFDRGYREMRARKIRDDAFKVYGAAIREERVVAEYVSERKREYVQRIITSLCPKWRAQADKARRFLDESEAYESDDFNDWDVSKPAMKFADGEPFNVDVCDGYTLPLLSDGGSDWYIADSEDTAGQAARAYWEDMAHDDKSEFACLVGEGALIAWALGESYAVGSEAVSSLEEWLDLSLTHPEEHFASYDGLQVEAWINDAACGEAGISVDDLDSEGWTRVVAYRHN